MRQDPEVKINFNKKRSFCYYNLNGRRFKVYNWKSSTTCIEPNKESNLVKRKEDLIKLKKAIEKDFRNTPFNIERNLYDQSLFNERIPISIFEHPIEGSIYAAKIIADTIINKQHL